VANLELISLGKETSYMAFGVSGSDHSTAMAGSDAAVANFEDGEPIAVYCTGLLPATRIAVLKA